MRTFLVRQLVIFLGYGLAAVGFTWPLALHLTTAIPGDGKDGWMETWTLWWVARAVLTGQSPWHTALQYAPGGTDLYLHTLMPLNGVLTLPLQVAWGPVVAYNVAVWLALAGSAWGAYLLARDRLRHAGVMGHGWRGELPPLVAGALFGFSPYMADHLLSHLNLLTAGGLPLATLALLRAAEGGDPARPWRVPWRWAVAAAVALIGTALCEWQYLFFLALGTAGWGTVTLLRRRGSQLVGPVVAWAIAGLILSPLIVGSLAQAAVTPATTPDGFAADLVAYSADPVAYVIPSPFQPWWGDWAAELLRPLPGTLIEKVMFPTYTGLALAALGWAVGRRQGRPVGGWLAGAGGFAVLSLGPVLHWDGMTLPVPLPAALLYALPIANLTRAPGRFVVMVLLALAVLAAYGLATLLQRPNPSTPFPKGEGGDPATGGRKPQVALALLAVGLLALELCPAPYRLAVWDVAPGTTALRSLPAGTAVLDLPVSRYETGYVQAQMVHEQPLFGGYVARPPAYPPLDGVPVFAELQAESAAPDLCAPDPTGLGPSMAAYFGVGAVVLHKDRLDMAGLAMLEQLIRQAGFGPSAGEDDRLVIYRPPPAPLPAMWANLDRSTWYDRESNATTGEPLHWMATQATIRVWRPVAGPATLDLQLQSYAVPRRVAVSVGDAPARVQTVGLHSAAVTVQLPPGQGATVVTLRALDPPTTPQTGGLNADPRLLSVALTGCALH